MIKEREVRAASFHAESNAKLWLNVKCSAVFSGIYVSYKLDLPCAHINTHMVECKERNVLAAAVKV